MREVEAQPLRCHERALLGHVLAEHQAQRLVNEVRRRVVGAGRSAPAMVDFEFDRIAGLERPFDDLADMDEDVAQTLLRVGDFEQGASWRRE